MKEIPILMSPPMVRALLHGEKTMTRRQLYVPTKGFASASADRRYPPTYGNGEWPNLPPGQAWTLSRWRNVQVGDKLWVRENLGYCSEYGHYYAADRTFLCSVFDDEEKATGYSYECAMRERSVPSIHLPRRWSRLTLEVTGARVERLQEISEADALAEGVSSVRSQAWDRLHFAAWRYNFEQAIEAGRKPPIGPTPTQAFRALWESINGPDSWDDNPWVVAIEFKVVTP